MTSDPSNPQDPSSAGGRRRSSFVDLFAARPPVTSQPNPPRRLSITTLGLSAAAGNQPTPYNTLRGRTESMSSANSTSVDESPFEEDTFSPSSAVPTSPFARRMSFGTKALRDQRSSTGSSPANGQNGTRPSVASNSSAQKASTSPKSLSREGFDFAETMRARAERTSISSASTFATMSQGPQRSKSIAVEQPQRELPKQPKAPDAFQERILKGDFYMD